jgi:hypothetical protein
MSASTARPPSPEYFRRFVRGWVGADETFPIIIKSGKHGPTRGFVDVPGSKPRWAGHTVKYVAGKKPAVYVGAGWLKRQAIPREALA